MPPRGIVERKGCSMKRIMSGLVVVAIVLGSFGARAQEEIWDGGGAAGGDVNWSAGANWLDDSAPIAGSALIFAGALDTTSTNNLAGTVAMFTWMAFSNSAFTLLGNPFTITSAGGMTNDAAANQNIINVVTANVAQTWHSALATRTITLNSNVVLKGNLTLTGGGNFTFNQPISGAFSLTVATTGTVANIAATVFNHTNTYSGSTFITASNRVQAAGNGMPGTGSIIISPGGQFYISGTGRTFANNFSISGNGVADAAAIGYLGALRLDGGHTLNGIITAAAPSRITAYTANDNTINGRIIGSSTLQKTGVGTLNLNNLTNLGFTGKWEVYSNGLLRARSDTSLGAVPGVTTADAITLNNGARLMNNSSPLVIHANRGITLASTGGALQSGWWTDVKVNSIIAGPGALTIAQDATPGWIILAGQNTFDGTLTIDARLRLGVNDALPNGTGKGNVLLNPGNALLNNGNLRVMDMNGFSDTINALNGGGALTNSRGNAVLTLGDNNASGSFTGSVAAAANGTLRLVKIGAGAQTLLGDIRNGVGLHIASGFMIATGSFGAGVSSDASGVLVARDAAAGRVSTPGTMALTNASLSFNPGAGAEGDLYAANDIELNGTVNVYVTPLKAIDSTPFLLFSYTNSIAGSAASLNVQPAGTRYTAFTASDVAGGIAIAMTGSGGPATLNYIGTNAAWDVTNAASFYNTGTTSTDVFYHADTVVFDADVKTNVVNLTGALAPASVIVGGPTNLTFQGTGRLSGLATIYKGGTNILAINNANDFDGAVVVTGGVLRAGNASALGSTMGATWVTNGGTLDVNGQNLGLEDFYLGGAGAGGTGAVINTGGQQVNAMQRVTLVADTVIGGAVRFDIRHAGILWPTNNAFLRTDGGIYSLTKTGTAEFAMPNVNVSDGIGNIFIDSGLLRSETGTTGLGNPAYTARVARGATLDIYSHTNAINKYITLEHGSRLTSQVGANAALNVLLGTVTLNGWATNEVRGGHQTLAGTITGAGGFTVLSNGTTYITGTNDWTGGLIVNTNANLNVGKSGLGGTLGSGSVTNFGNLYFTRTNAYTIANEIVGRPEALIAKQNLGTLTLDGMAANYLGNFQLQGGTLLIGPSYVSGTNQIEFTSTNAVIASSDGTARTISNLTWWTQGPQIGAGGDLTFSGVTHNNGVASKAISVSNSLTRFTGTLYGVGTVAKRGPGELRFENAVSASSFTNLEGRLTLTGAGAFTHATAALTFNQGSVFDVAGVTGGWYLRQGQTLRGNVGVVGDSLISNSFVRPGASAGTITFSNNVTFSNADVEFELASDGTPGAGINDYIETIGNLTLSGVSTVRVVALNNQFAPTHVLWTNGGTRTGGAANLLLANVGIMTNSRYGFAISDADPQRIVLNVSGSAKALTWQGGATGFWNAKGSTNNFLDGVTPDAFWQADSVTFGGSATRRTVTIAEPVAPGLVTVSAPYTLAIAGSGKITGGATLLKTGDGALIINNPHDFTGATLISNGIVQARANTALGTAAGGTYIAAGGTLDTYGNNLGYEHVYAVGAGYTNGGAIVNLSGVAQTQTLRRVTLTGDTTLGGVSTWDLRGVNIADGWLSTGGNAYNLIKVGTNTIRLVDVAVDAALADIEIRQGVLGFEASTPGLGNPMKTLTVYPTASLWFNSINAPVAKNVILQDGGGIWLQGGAIGSSQNFFTQPVVLSNGLGIVDGGANGLFSQFTGAGGLRKLGAGEVWLTGTNDFTGQFRMSAGALRLISNGSMTAVSGVLMEGGTLHLDNSRDNLGNRLNDAAGITGWGGTINFATANSIGVTESIGNVLMERGGLTINLEMPVAFGTTSTVFIAGLSQQQGILNFTFGNSGTFFPGQNPSNNYGAHIMVGGLTNGQTIPWATVNGAGFARYSTTNGIYAPLEIAEFNAAADQTGQDLRFTFERDGGANVLTASRSINTIVVSNQYNTFIDLAGNDLTLSGGGYRQLGNENFMITNSGVGGSLIAGDAVFFVNSSTTRLASAATLTSLAKEGGGTLIVLGNLSYTGRTAINGVLQVGEGGAASIPTDTPVYNHGTLRFRTTTDLDFSSNIRGLGGIEKFFLNTLTLSGTSNLIGGSFNIYSGAVVFAAGSSTYMTNMNGTFAIGSSNTSPIATMTIKPGALLDLGAINNFLGANYAPNNHSIINQEGGTFLIGSTNLNNVRFAHWPGSNIYNMAGGLLVVSNRLTLAWDGRSYFNQSNGTVKAGQITLTPLDGTARVRTSQWNLVNGTLLLGTGGMTVNSNNMTAPQQFNVGSGTLAAWKTNTQVSQRIPVNISGALTLDGVAGDTVEMLGRTAGAGAITKIGAGTAILAGTNLHLGGTTISNGTLAVKTGNALGSGTLTMSGGTLNLSLAGLNEADLAGNFNQNTNPVGTVTLGTSLAHFEQSVSSGQLAGNATAGYRGFLVVGGPTNVTYTFAESFDDNVMLRITTGGVVNTVLNNTSWNTPTKGTITLAPGRYLFDLRVGNGAGGGGAAGHGWWTNVWTMGFGYDPQGRDQEIVGNYIKMTDPGDGSLFLSDTNGFTVPNTVDVTADSAISLIGAGGAKMTMSGPFGIGSQRLTVTNTGAGALALTGPMTLSGSPTFDVVTNVTVTAAGAIGGGANGINKAGPGTLRLTGTNTYTGTTRVMDGVMELAEFGEIGSSATLRIDAGAKFVATNNAGGTIHLVSGMTLQGNGTFEGGLITDPGSAVAPGVGAAGSLTVMGNMQAENVTTFSIEINGTTPGTQYDQLAFGGGNTYTLTLNSPDLQVLLGYTPAYGSTFAIVSGFGTLAGTGEFNGKTDGSTFTVGATEFQIDYNPNDITLTVVPEPASLGVMGLLGIAGWLLRRRARTH